MVNLIVAVSENRVIGNQGVIPWNEPEDLKYFKNLTMGFTIVMGRKTFESLPFMLPGRKHVIISRTLKNDIPNCEVYDNILDAVSKNPDCFIIGGSEIYSQSLQYVNVAYVTEVGGHYDGDAYFPELPSNFVLKNSTKEKNLTFNKYIKENG